MSKVEPERGFNNKNHENKTILCEKLNNDIHEKLSTNEVLK
jgi:hypothetical protein